jgi:hypothetical protein
MLKRFSSLFRKPVSSFNFGTYKINLGKLNTLEINTEVELNPVFISLCNELAQTDSYAHKPFLLMKKMEDVIININNLSQEHTEWFNYCMSLIGILWR